MVSLPALERIVTFLPPLRLILSLPAPASIVTLSPVFVTVSAPAPTLIMTPLSVL